MSPQYPELIDQMTTQLQACARDGKWQKLASLDEQIAALLRRIQPAPKELEPALDRLRSAHAFAQSQATQAAQDLQRRIETLGNHGEGLRAYQQMENNG